MFTVWRALCVANMTVLGLRVPLYIYDVDNTEIKDGLW